MEEFTAGNLHVHSITSRMPAHRRQKTTLIGNGMQIAFAIALYYVTNMHIKVPKGIDYTQAKRS